MHILIAFLTALASVLYAMDRLGVDIGWLNPWAWRRRRRWMKQLHTNPAFNLDSPLEAMALLLLATAKIEGVLEILCQSTNLYMRGLTYERRVRF